MSKIAIIDTGISPAGLHCQSFKSYNIYGKQISESNLHSHGTSCAKVLDYCTSEYELISIQILPACTEPGKKTFGQIKNLKKALMLCAELIPDIICLSSVSSLLSDSQYLYDISKKLSEKATIISALDNKQYITVPSSFPFVMGVQSDRMNILPPGDVGYHQQDPFFAPYYANCNFHFIQDYHCTPSNSLAVPVVAAYMNNKINQGISPKQAMNYMKPYPRKKDVLSNTFSLITEYEPPLVFVHGSQQFDSFYACQSTMDELYAIYGVQSAGVCTAIPKYDIRFRKLNSVYSIKKDVEFIRRHYKTDIIFLVTDDDIPDTVCEQLCLDMKITINGCRINTYMDGICAVDSRKNMAHLIYHMLQ